MLTTITKLAAGLVIAAGLGFGLVIPATAQTCVGGSPPPCTPITPPTVQPKPHKPPPQKPAMPGKPGQPGGPGQVDTGPLQPAAG